MVEEGPYEILPYAEIDVLKKEIEDLKRKSASSDEILDSINRLVKVMESMLHLFESAAAGMKKEGGIGKKLDKLLDQQETLAESILSVADMVKDIHPKEQYIIKEKPQPIIPEPPREPMPRIEPKPDFSMPPGFERPMPRGPLPSPAPRAPPVPPIPENIMPTPPKEGPMPMPTGSFKDLKLPKKQKKGLFGRFRK